MPGRRAVIGERNQVPRRGPAKEKQALVLIHGQLSRRNHDFDPDFLRGARAGLVTALGITYCGPRLIDNLESVPFNYRTGIHQITATSFVAPLIVEEIPYSLLSD